MAIDLKDFIKVALSDITSAVKESQSELDGFACVAPTHSIGYSRDDMKWTENRYSKISSIEFDIAVTSESTEKSKESGSSGISVLSVMSLGVGRKNEETQEILSQSISRIKFSIPVAFAMNVPNANKFFSKSQ